MSEEPGVASSPVGRVRLAVVAFILGVLGLLGGLPYLPLYGVGFAFVPEGFLSGWASAFCALAGVVFGPVALRRCERQHRPGSALALGGLIAGSLGLPGLLMMISLARVGGQGGLDGIFFGSCW